MGRTWIADPDGRARSARSAPFPRLIPDEDVIDAAVGIIVDVCSPRTIYLYGPCAAGYVDHNRSIDAVVVIGRGDPDRAWDDIVTALAYQLISVNLTVLTERQFRKDLEHIYTDAYEAATYGRVAYAV